MSSKKKKAASARPVMAKKARQAVVGSPASHMAEPSEISEIKNSYDDLMYESKAFSQTAINALEARARMMGLKPAAAVNAKVLELGCSMGGNIITQALYYPDAEFIGID